MKTRTLAVPLLAALGLAAAPVAATASTPTPPAHEALYFYVAGEVLRGEVEGVPGSRHQLRISYEEGSTDGWIRSWSCPEGATVTTTWASSRCDHRITQDLREKWADPPFAWVSSTGHSGVFEEDTLVGVNRDSGYRRVISADLTFHKNSDAHLQHEEGQGPDDDYRDRIDTVNYYWWTDSQVWGGIGGAKVWVSGSDLQFGWTT